MRLITHTNSGTVGERLARKHRSIQRFSVMLWFAVVLMCLSVAANGSGQSPDDAELVAPLFITNVKFMSVLLIRNTSDSPIHALVKFDSLEGEEVGYRLADVSPHSSMDIDVDDVAFPVATAASTFALPTSLDGSSAASSPSRPGQNRKPISTANF